MSGPIDKHDCPGKYERWYIGPVRRGRKRVDGIVMTGEWRECKCICHIPEEDRPKPKRKYTRKKKT